MTEEQLLEIFTQTGVLKEGHFLLSSGLHSGQYMQCAQLMQYPEQAATVCSALAQKFSHLEIDVVIGPALGGVLVAYETARALGKRNLFAERENGVMTLRRGFEIKPGEKVLVVEDVVTTGGSVKEVMKVVQEAGGVVVGVAALVDRSRGQADFGGVPFAALLQRDIPAYQPEECPLCKEGVPLVKPGSRTVPKN